MSGLTDPTPGPRPPRPEYQEQRALEERISRLELENEHLNHERLKALQSAKHYKSRVDQYYRMWEKSQMQTNILGDQVTKLQHRIGRQREANREQHRALKEARERADRFRLDAGHWHQKYTELKERSERAGDEAEA